MLRFTRPIRYFSKKFNKLNEREEFKAGMREKLQKEGGYYEQNDKKYILQGNKFREIDPNLTKQQKQQSSNNINEDEQQKIKQQEIENLKYILLPFPILFILIFIIQRTLRSKGSTHEQQLQEIEQKMKILEEQFKSQSDPQQKQ